MIYLVELALYVSVKLQSLAMYSSIYRKTTPKSSPKTINQAVPRLKTKR